MTLHIEAYPLTNERWEDFCTLFGPNGACSGCWCMWWRVPNKEFHEGAVNQDAFRRVVDEGSPPGLLGYEDGVPVGWVSLGPRTDFRRFASIRKNTFAPVDDLPVWSLVCFYVHKQRRRAGVTRAMLQVAIAWARDQGAAILEAYPNDVPGKVRPVDVFMGTPSLFAREGFVEVARREPTRPIMRLALAETHH